MAIDVQTSSVTCAGQRFELFDLAAATAARGRPLPYCLRGLLENLLRGRARHPDAETAAEALLAWDGDPGTTPLPLTVDRIVLPDSSGLPALMDLAALRDIVVARGGDPEAVDPQVQVDLVVDHSLIVDRAGTPDAAAFNETREIERNAERYRFFKWAQQAFRTLRVVPPGRGIIHQIHLEYLAQVVGRQRRDDGDWLFPELVLGCDSHTPTINALGILAWGVGGIEAEAAMLGRPYILPMPRVVGVELKGRIRPGVTTTDLVLAITRRLREVGVVGAFVEFFGDAVASLPVPQRATLANMAPEYGATVGFFPIDAQTIAYLRESGRDESQIERVESYARAAGLYRESDAPRPWYSEVLTVDLAETEPCVAGPQRPDQLVTLSQIETSFIESGLAGEAVADGRPAHGSLAIAAITSCTNTANPLVMVAAGLLARKARARGLKPPPWVKTSLAPGSRVVTRYLSNSGLLEDLEALGFHVVGYGCTTCSGKSGEIAEELSAAARDAGTVLAAVLSGNRNFDMRIHPEIRANYLASPPLVVAFALAGRIGLDMARDPLGKDRDGEPVYLQDLWPSEAEIDAALAATSDPALYREMYADLFEGSAPWQALEAPRGPLYRWDESSTYIRRPPFFERDQDASGLPDRIDCARVLCLLGDSVTTDHVTPSAMITASSAAGAYLDSLGVPASAFNSYTQRRGNHEVMARATFSNRGLRNLLPGVTKGGYTLRRDGGREETIFDAAEAYARDGLPVIVLAGRNYGMGSSRDWAAKGPALLKVRAVLAESFERIHRSNLIGMGIVPLVFQDTGGWRELGIDGTEVFTLSGLRDGVLRDAPIAVEAEHRDGRTLHFTVRASLESQSERGLLAEGGIFPAVLRAFTENDPESSHRGTCSA